MNRKVTRLVRAGKYVAEVAVERIPDDGAWGPYLSSDDVQKLERAENSRAERRSECRERGCKGV